MPKETKEEKARHTVEEALYVQGQIQKMNLLDAQRFRDNKKALAVLVDARDHLNKLIGKCGYDEKDEDEGDDEDMDERDTKDRPVKRKSMADAY